MSTKRLDEYPPEVRAQHTRQRGWFVIGLAVLLLLSLVLPHVALEGEPAFGRSLLPTSFYFLHVQPTAWAAPVDISTLAFGFNLLYLGLGLHQLGLLFTIITFWSFYPEEFNRWIYRILVIGGWMLLLSTPLLVAGRLAVGQAGVPIELGVAWIPLLVAGVVITVAARRARSRIDNTWYLSRQELM